MSLPCHSALVGPVKCPALDTALRTPVIRQGHNIRCIGLVLDLLGLLKEAIQGVESRTEEATAALGKGIELKVLPSVTRNRHRGSDPC